MIAKRLISVITLSSIVLTSNLILSGCAAPIVLGASAVTAAFAATDRRSVGTQIEDKNIQLRAASELAKQLGEGAQVNVTVYNRKVLLTGEAPNEFTRNRAEGAVSNILNVTSVVNDIKIAGASSVTSRSNDSLITGKVKTALINSQDVSAQTFKVVTEAGSVYLMGIATEREASRAASIAAGVSGVQRVVKVIEIISEAALANMAKTGSVKTPEPSRGPSQ